MAGGVRKSRLAFAALGFGVAAALSSWNPLSAPFGAIVGIAAALLSVRALLRRERRAVAAAALAASILAVIASAVVLGLSPGLGRELRGKPIVPAPGHEDAAAQIEGAAERTHAGRERARSELESLENPPKPTPPPESGGAR